MEAGEGEERKGKEEGKGEVLLSVLCSLPLYILR